MYNLIITTTNLESHEGIGAVRREFHERAHGHQLGSAHVVQRELVLEQLGKLMKDER